MDNSRPLFGESGGKRKKRREMQTSAFSHFPLLGTWSLTAQERQKVNICPPQNSRVLEDGPSVSDGEHETRRRQKGEGRRRRARTSASLTLMRSSPTGAVALLGVWRSLSEFST